MKQNFLIRSQYEYTDSNDEKVLKFGPEEHFVLIKDADGTDWFYVLNENGQIGYVPNSYVVFEESLTGKQILDVIDKIASKLENSSQSSVVTDRQRKHAQIKLATIRCEVQQQEADQQNNNKLQSTTAARGPELTSIQENGEDSESSGNSPSRQQRASIEQYVNENLISNLIENLKLDTNLIEEKAIVVTGSVLRTLSENIPPWQKDVKRMLDVLEKYCHEKVNSENVYSTKLKCIFKRLCVCKDDSQQRSWPVYEDEELINGYLDELLHLLIETKESFLENEICSRNCENIQLLIAYFQMESRRSLRMKLMETFITIIKLFHKISPEFFVTTVLPLELAQEMQNHLADKERWIKASILFTLIFSSGHTPTVGVYEHLDESYFSRQFDLIEGFDISGQPVECDIPPEYIISPILAFNLHMNGDVAENVIFKALRRRTNASHFSENLISYLNWEEDIILTNSGFARCHDEQESVPNSVLKFLIEMFQDKVVSSLFYYNDVRVIIDIIISQLDNLPVGDKRIKINLQLTWNILKNTQYEEEPHKVHELKKCLLSIQHHEFSNQEDIEMSQNILDTFSETFSSLR